MKRYFEIIYWFAATGLISLLFTSLAESYAEAFIVNRSCVIGMSAGRLRLDSSMEIDVSKRYREMVEEWFIK